ncbi:MAG: xanthine dehydrogenase accessory protein XdhC [Pirellulales bacterium]
MPAPHGFIETLAEMLRGGLPLVSVTMVEAIGSTPQDTGSKMIVSTEGLQYGTVGGGKIEHQAIEYAKNMLVASANEASAHELVEWNLQRDVGMTCGGVVKLFFESYHQCVWRVAIFGAGHVAQAVIHCLKTLDCRITCIDPRQEWLDRIEAGGQLEKFCTVEPHTQVENLADDTFVLCMTMGHRTDRPILEEIFRQQRQFPYLGVIGSKSKRAVLSRELRAAGIAQEQIDTIHCPIGLPLGTNQPGEIAVSVVAQLIEQRDAWRKVIS